MRKLIIGIVFLVALGLVVDFGSAAYAEYRVSRELRAGASLTADPEVTVHGFPFLTQAWEGKYNDIEIRARGVQSSEVGEVTIESTLQGVTAPLSELVDGTVATVPVDHLSGRMLIDATELGQFLGIADLQVSAPPANRSDGTGGSGGSGTPTAGGVVLTGTVPVGPIETTVSVHADLVLDNGQVKIVASDFNFGPNGSTDYSIPDPLAPVILGLFTQTIDPRELPFGVQPTEVYARGSQIVIEGVGNNVTITLDGLQRR
ncbi:LmeA family phospholipid-binding protein [Rhodococcus sp. WMMA185]|uniref:LmeA family phospholipid-binding protein n=1 Tax=Rhodococcus sp. WMMA185 TaxID=679318 RepID=UPI0008787741|nr:LmeA family phospholipid-binding protein [Rhodococcus sp. WMMA185]